MEHSVEVILMLKQISNSEMLVELYAVLRIRFILIRIRFVETRIRIRPKIEKILPVFF